MSTTNSTRKVIPAELGFLAIYNPSLGTTDDTVGDQIVYYTNPSSHPRDRSKTRNVADKKADDEKSRQQRNAQLRQVGLAQGMVEFGRSFSDGRAVDTIETDKSRIVLHELEAGWWILASINLTILPGSTKVPASRGKPAEEKDTIEYSSREVKPAILLLGDLLRAHSTFLLHHASSMSALFVRTRRSKFVGILGRYWDTFVSSWNVLMHGNPATSLYGGIKIAACGELGMGVGEEDRGSGEREVLEGFVGRIDGLVDVIVSKFGEGETNLNGKQNISHSARPSQPWLGSGDEPATADGAVFLGTGALSRKSLRDVTHWMEDLYRWGENSYGVIDNPSSNRRPKKAKSSQAVRGRKEPVSEGRKSVEAQRPKLNRVDLESQTSQCEDAATPVPRVATSEGDLAQGSKSHSKRPTLKRAPGSANSTESESAKANTLMQYLKLGYGTHWSLGGPSTKAEGGQDHSQNADKHARERSKNKQSNLFGTSLEEESVSAKKSRNYGVGHFLIGLLGDFESDDDAIYPEDMINQDEDHHDTRLLLRTLTVELEREEDARAEADISIDLRNVEKDSRSTNASSEHTATSNTSFESQDRNKTKKLRVVVYVQEPFIFVFLFELRTDALALTSLYRSLHHQLQPLQKPLTTSTAFRASKPELSPASDSTTPIFDLIWDPKQLTVNSTIPNIPDPFLPQTSSEAQPWNRIEALNTHMQIINTYISSSTDNSELERTCKTSRGWWVVWTRVPDSNPPELVPFSGKVPVPGLIAEDSMDYSTSRLDIRGRKSGASGRRSPPVSEIGSSMVSGPAHPFLEASLARDESVARDKEIFLIRRASDHTASTTGRFVSGASAIVQDAGWASAPAKLAQGIGVDTQQYIEALLNLNK